MLLLLKRRLVWASQAQGGAIASLVTNYKIVLYLNNLLNNDHYGYLYYWCGPCGAVCCI